MKKILFPLLLLFCVSDIQDFQDSNAPETLIAVVDFPMVLVEDNEMCKPTGVETVTYTDGKAEPAPEKKKPTAKTTKKKSAKKIRQKDA